MSSDDLRVSAIIPAYNAARFLAEAVASIRAQDRPVAEIIIVDDGSTDGSAKLAESLGTDIRVLRHDRNKGLASARNTGIVAVRGTVMAFIDADDLWPSDAMRHLLSCLEMPPYLSIVAGRIKVTGDGPMPFDGHRVAQERMEGFAMNFNCSVFRRQVFDEVGLLDAEVRYEEDADWFLRARERGVSIAVIHALTLIYRRHDANMTLHRDYTMRSSLETIKRSLDRRRAAGKAASLPRWRTLMRGDR